MTADDILTSDVGTNPATIVCPIRLRPFTIYCRLHGSVTAMHDLPRRLSNNIGLLRFVLASLVIIGHAPEMIDGTRACEPLTRIFGTVSIGDLAVDGFFMLSGFLIAQSLERQYSLVDFLIRRVVRIYPAFIAAYLLSVYAFGAAVGAHPFAAGIEPIIRMAGLFPPDYMPSKLDGLPYPLFNDAMWTIAFEFRCYIFAALLFRLGLFRRRALVSIITTLMLAGFILSGIPDIHDMLANAGKDTLIAAVVIDPSPMIRLLTAFLIGVCIYLNREDILPNLGRRTAFLGGVLAIAALAGNPLIAEPGLLIGGSVVLFWLSFKARMGAIGTVNNEWDVSYGTYLYGWPIATALVWLRPDIGPWAVAGVTLLLAWAMGAASWWAIEKPALVWVRNYLSNREAVTRQHQHDRPVAYQS